MKCNGLLESSLKYFRETYIPKPFLGNHIMSLPLIMRPSAPPRGAGQVCGCRDARAVRVVSRTLSSGVSEASAPSEPLS